MALESYFDEAGSHRGSPVLSVAGYVFARAQARRFDRAWRRILAVHGLPYFRASQCAHRQGPFVHLSDKQRNALMASLIQTIRQHYTLGLAVMIVEKEFDERMPQDVVTGLGHAYSFALQGCLVDLGRWAGDNRHPGPVAYFFESGHAHQSEANLRMQLLAADASVSAYCKYGSHTFADKKQVAPLQAADLLAYELYKYYTDTARGTTRIRRSLEELLKQPRNYIIREPLEGAELTRLLDGAGWMSTSVK